MADFASKIESARKKAQELREVIKSNRDKANDTTLRNASSNVAGSSKPPIKPRRTLKGHAGKIYAMHWAQDAPSMVSAGQDGVLIVWDGITTCKTHAFALKCTWVMTCGFAPSANFVACGGLDNTCSIYNLQGQNPQPIRELQGHNGHLSGCRFINNSKILTCSGDKSTILWDIETGKLETEFKDHDGDVLSISVAPDSNYFVSGSLDRTAKVFDIREKRLAQITFRQHNLDVNSVSFFPSGQAFGTGSEDKTAKIFDIRSAGELISFGNSENADDPPFTSVCFSKSGKYFFGAQDIVIRCWDTLKGDTLDSLKGHRDIISSIGVSGDGKALGTSSWDNTMKIYA